VLVSKDGATDWEATARNAEKARQHLEGRLGGGDAPPKSADEYKVNVPAAVADKINAEDLAKDPTFQEFKTALHGAGLNQKQADVVIGQFLERSINLQNALTVLKSEECTTELKGTWKTDAEYQAGVAAAYRAGAAYGDIDKLLTKYGNDPDFIRFAANVGKELSEDASPTGGASAAQALQQEHDSLAAYLNDASNRSKPEFEGKKTRYAELGKRLFGDGPKKSGSMSFQQTV
jgi:hypothetical protein